MAESDPRREARRIRIAGRVQGVGYRPFVYRLADRLGVSGWVMNGAGEVDILAEAEAEVLDRFERSLIDEAPPLARARLAASGSVPPSALVHFEVRQSKSGSRPDIHLPPDHFCCDDCLRELRDPRERRFGYAFTNCTQCGPRYTIIKALPYDRANTSLAGFPLCDECTREYENPLDRRFHAQPLACPNCGPSISFSNGSVTVNGPEALDATIRSLKRGEIVAVKGIGGYHLVCDATNNDAVATLRSRKQRPDKPLAVMFQLVGSDGLDQVREYADASPEEARALVSPERPIVLVRKKFPTALSGSLAPGLKEIGALLPYSPLHALLLDAVRGPLVATSGNISGEPVLTDNEEAERRLAGIADAFLHHNRPILRPADDSVIRVIAGKARPIRLGRGIAPLEFELQDVLHEPVLAVGGHLKVTVALGWGRRVVVSPHIGDLDSVRSLDVFENLIADLQSLYGVRARAITCDLHPRYASTRFAAAQGLPLIPVQHHHVHASALAGEHPEIAKWLTLAWDGIGYGEDGTLWGGETFSGRPGDWTRVASIRPFRIAGGDKVGREPWRSAAGLMWEAGLPHIPRPAAAGLVADAWRKSTNCVTTSSAGRLFDAAASIVLGVDTVSFEGQGPMLLEAAAEGHDGEEIDLPLQQDAGGLLRLDWAPLLTVMSDETRSSGDRAASVHKSLGRAIAEQIKALGRKHDFEAVGLTGGVFQNRLLAEDVVSRLQSVGVPVYIPETVPANDGGLAFGQIVEALHTTRSRRHVLERVSDD